MKKFRIRADISGTAQVWTLDEKIGWKKWKSVFKHEDITIVKKMKDHLLQQPTIYTLKNNTPESPLRSRPSGWKPVKKLQHLRIKRSELPTSLQFLD